MTINRSPSREKENALKRRNRVDPEVRRTNALKDRLIQSQYENDYQDISLCEERGETNDDRSDNSWLHNDYDNDEENLHHDTAPSESKARYGAQVVLQRRNYGKATTTTTKKVTGRTSNLADGSKQQQQHLLNNISQSYPARNIHRRNSPQRFFNAKRRKFIIYSVVGLALFGYFFQMTQLVEKMGSGERYKQWKINLPDHTVGLNYEKQQVIPHVKNKVIVPNREEWDRVRALTKRRAQERRNRSRPPNLYFTAAAAAAVTKSEYSSHKTALRDNIDSGPTIPRLTLDIPVHRSLDESLDKTFASTTNENNQSGTSTTICGIHALDASTRDSTNYPASTSIGSTSRVVVTGALSQLGMEIILQLHKDCGVEHVLGIDSALPNTQHDRLAALERYRFLVHNVPSFKLSNDPIFGVAPHPKSGNEREFDLIDWFKPSHIIHLMGIEEGNGEYASFGDMEDISPYVANGHSSMMRRFQSLVSMDQILSSIAKFKREESDKAQPQFVYLSSAEVEYQSGVPLANEKTIQSTASVYGTCSLLKEVLASYYYRHHGVESVGMRIPTVYGPFARPGSLIYELMERTIYNTSEKSDDRYALETMWRKRDGAELGALEQMTYAPDLAQAFVAAIQYRGDRTSGPALIQLGSKDTISMKEIERRASDYLSAQVKVQTSSELDQSSVKGLRSISNVSSNSHIKRNLHLLGWSQTTDIKDGLRSMIAWQIMKAHPLFAPPSSDSGIKEFINESQVPYVGLSVTLPCVSGCAWHGKCLPSVWDAVVEEARAATVKCKYVLYTVDLRSSLFELKDKPAKSNDGKDICKIAFVSSSSALARRDKPSQQRKDKWTLIAVNGEESSLTEAELSLAKLSPTMLFSESVSYAFYVNHRRSMASTDDVSFAIQSMKMNSVKEKTRKIFKENGKVKKTWIQPRSKRHSIMFLSRLATPEGHNTSSAPALARFVMSNNGVKMTERVKRQIQFYQYASHLVRTNMMRSTNYASYIQENNFPFEYLRSTWVLHDLNSEEAQKLRCEIYEEHTAWGNHDMEDFSMAFVLAKRTILSKLGKMAAPQYEGPQDWYPLLASAKTKDNNDISEGSEYLEYLDPSQKSVAKNHRGSEIYISFLSRQVTSSELAGK